MEGNRARERERESKEVFGDFLPVLHLLMHTHKHTYTLTNTQLHAHTHTQTCTHTRNNHTHKHTHTHAHTITNKHSHTHTRSHTHTHTRTYTHFLTRETLSLTHTAEAADEVKRRRREANKKTKKKKRGAEYWLEEAEGGDVNAQYVFLFFCVCEWNVFKCWFRTHTNLNAYACVICTKCIYCW